MESFKFPSKISQDMVGGQKLISPLSSTVSDTPQGTEDESSKSQHEDACDHSPISQGASPVYDHTSEAVTQCAPSQTVSASESERVNKQENLTEQDSSVEQDQCALDQDQDNLLAWVGRSDAESRSPSPEPQYYSSETPTRCGWQALNEDEDIAPKTESSTLAKKHQSMDDSDIPYNQVHAASDIKDKNKTPEALSNEELINQPKETPGQPETDIPQHSPAKPRPWWVFLPQWEDYFPKATEWAKFCEYCHCIFANKPQFCENCKTLNWPLMPPIYTHFIAIMGKDVLEWVLDFYNAPKVDWLDGWEVNVEEERRRSKYGPFQKLSSTDG